MKAFNYVAPRSIHEVTTLAEGKLSNGWIKLEMDFPSAKCRAALSANEAVTLAHTLIYLAHEARKVGGDSGKYILNEEKE